MQGTRADRERGKHRVASVMIVLSLVGLAPLYTAELTTADGWNIDLETGVEYREIRGDELNRTPWTPQNSTVYTFRKYGDLIDFETQATAGITMVANGSIFSVDFSFVYETQRKVWETNHVKNGTDETGEALNRSGTVTLRMYVGDSEYGNQTWVAGRAFDGFADGFWATGLGPDDNFVRVFQNQTNYLLDSDVDDDDLLSVVSADCTEAGDGGGSGGPIRFESASSTVSGCKTPRSRNMSAPSGCDATTTDECRRFFYAGETRWCEEHGIRAQWVLAVEDTYEDNAATFYETRVAPTRGGATCWFTSSYNPPPWQINGRGFDHSNWYCHQHRENMRDCEEGEEIGNQHPYPYNPVGHNRDDGYCATDRDGRAILSHWENEHNFTAYQANVWDDFKHTQNHLQDKFPEPDNIQVLHRPDDCLVVGENAYIKYGQGDRPGQKSVATINRDPAGYVSSHELGHNYDAIHKRSTCLVEGGFTMTVMGDAQTAQNKDCWWEDEGFERVYWMSGENEDRVDNYVGG